MITPCTITAPAPPARAALRILLVLTVLLGLAYPLAVFGVGQARLPDQANGSLVERRRQPSVGVRPIARPSADSAPGRSSSSPGRRAGDGYDPLATGGSNLGPNNPDLLAGRSRSAGPRSPPPNGVDPAAVPADAVTASGVRARPAHLPGVRRPAGRPGRRGPRPGPRRRAPPWSTEHTERRVARLPRRAARQRAGAQPGPRAGRPDVGQLIPRTPADNPRATDESAAWQARARCGSTWAPRPGWARPTTMLDEGHRRGERGTDVVVGVRRDPRPAADRGRCSRAWRSCPARRIELPRRRRSPRWTSTPCWPARPRSRSSTSSPTPTSPGAGNAKRWQDVDELLDAGIDVITTVNIQHLESLNDVVEPITGVRQRETVPDEVVRRGRPDRAGRHDPGGAAPAAGPRQRLRRREDRRRAVATTSGVGNLTALRELALLWLADQVDEALRAVPRRARASTDTWQARERVVVALTGGPEGETLIRRGARIADSRSRR